MVILGKAVFGWVLLAVHAVQQNILLCLTVYLVYYFYAPIQRDSRDGLSSKLNVNAKWFIL